MRNRRHPVAGFLCAGLMIYGILRTGEYVLIDRHGGSEDKPAVVTDAKIPEEAESIPCSPENWDAYPSDNAEPQTRQHVSSAAEMRRTISVPPVRQHPEYPTGCESIALYMLLRYYGVEVTPEDIVEALPKGPVPYDAGGVTYGANPEREFVGDPRDAHSYGVYNQPICDTANQFLDGAVTKTGATVDEICRIIDSGAPVIAWYTTNDEIITETGATWRDELTGAPITWQRYEHAVLVCGCSKYEITFNDPNTGTRRTVRAVDFAAAFEAFGGRIVYYPR